MRINILSGIALLGLALAAPSEENTRDIDASSYVEWNGYTEKDFNGTVKKSGYYSGYCLSITAYKLIHELNSAIVTYGKIVYLYTGKNCDGDHIHIDVNGYRDMSQLPQYHSWYGSKT